MKIGLQAYIQGTVEAVEFYQNDYPTMNFSVSLENEEAVKKAYDVLMYKCLNMKM